MKQTAFLLVLSFALLASAALRADALADLRAKLSALKPAGAFAARIEIRSTGSNDDEGTASRNEKSASIDALQDAAGIHLAWSAAQIEMARRENAEQQRHPDAPKSGGLAELSATSAAALLDAAPGLLLRLEGATLVDSHAENYQGKPATLIVVTPRNTLSEKDRKRIKKYETSMKIWLDAQGWPLAAESKVHLKASMYLISFTADHSATESFAHTADRLYFIARTEENSGAGLGQKGGDRVVTKVTPLG